jgi:hypothetical protein
MLAVYVLQVRWSCMIVDSHLWLLRPEFLLNLINWGMHDVPTTYIFSISHISMFITRIYS